MKVDAKTLPEGGEVRLDMVERAVNVVARSAKEAAKIRAGVEKPCMKR